MMMPPHLRAQADADSLESQPRLAIPQTRSSEFRPNNKIMSNPKTMEKSKKQAAEPIRGINRTKSWEALMQRQAQKQNVASLPELGVPRTRSAEFDKGGCAKMNSRLQSSPSLARDNRILVPANCDGMKQESGVELSRSLKSVSTKREIKPATKRDLLSNQLRRSESDERRGAIAAHLNSILGDDENE